MNLKNEINSRFTTVGSKVDRLAELTTQEIDSLNAKVNEIYNTLTLMQEAMVSLEKLLLTVLEEDQENSDKP